MYLIKHLVHPGKYIVKKYIYKNKKNIYIYYKYIIHK